MNEKKDMHDELVKKHHFKLWEEDLEVFLASLDKYEAQEEEDRLAHGTVANEGKPKRKKAAKKKDVQSTAETKPEKGTDQPMKAEKKPAKAPKKLP